MAIKKMNLYDLDYGDLEATVMLWGEPKYRVRQIWEWLYRHKVTDIDEMTTLSKKLRQQLKQLYEIYIPPVLDSQESLDGETRKDLLKMRDGEQVEVILMRYIDRRSVCISTQVGCAVGCKFCATGQMGFIRNLNSGEIISQVLHFARDLEAQGQSLSNVVFMGMGEPFLNYDNTIAAIYRLLDQEGFKMGQRRITVSTAGIIPGIQKFTEEGFQVNLAISLHAATDELRNQLMPINQRYSLEPLFKALGDYIAYTNRQVTFEWVLINGVNDTAEQANALAARLKGMLAHVNLIPLNPTIGYEGEAPPAENIDAFTAILDNSGVSYSVRLRRGGDIQAGCGQLRRRQTQ